MHYYLRTNHVNKMAPCASNKKSAAPKIKAAPKAAAQVSPDLIDLGTQPDSDSPAQGSAGGEGGPPRPEVRRIRPEDMTNEERIAFGLEFPPDGQGHPDADHSPEPIRIRKVKPESPCKRSKTGSPGRAEPPFPGRTPPNPNDEIMTGDVSPTGPFVQPEEFMATSRFPVDWAAIRADEEASNTMKDDDPAPVTPPPLDNTVKDDNPAPLTPPAPQASSCSPLPQGSSS